MKEVIFELDHWIWKSLEDFVAYKDMCGLVNSREAIEAYKKDLHFFALEPELHPEGSASKMRDHLEASIKRSLLHFASQTIVSLCTTYEVSARQFFRCLFIKHPAKMHDFLGDGNQRGTLKLRDVINAGGYAEVIDEASKKAADGAVKGKYAEVLRRAAKLCKSAMGNEIAEGLGAVQTLRNRIVHEKHAANLGVKEVGEVQGNIAGSIALLGRFALEMDLPGKYTYLLPTVNIEIDSIALLHPSDS